MTFTVVYCKYHRKHNSIISYTQPPQGEQLKHNQQTYVFIITAQCLFIIAQSPGTYPTSIRLSVALYYINHILILFLFIEPFIFLYSFIHLITFPIVVARGTLQVSISLYCVLLVHQMYSI